MAHGFTRDCLVSIIYDVLDKRWDGDMSPYKISEVAADALITAGIEVATEPSEEEREIAACEARAELDEYLLDLHNDQLADEAMGK